MVKSLSSLPSNPLEAVVAESQSYPRYFASRQFAKQGRVILFGLARELYENFSPEEARGFLSQIGARIARDIAIPAVSTIDELEAEINVALAELDWGYLVIAVEEHAVVMRQYAFPGHVMSEEGAPAWRRAFAAILEGVYTAWMHRQGGSTALYVKVTNDTGADVLEFAYGV